MRFPILLTLGIMLTGTAMMVGSHYLVQKTKHWKLARWLFWSGLLLLVAPIAVWSPRYGAPWWNHEIQN